MDKLNLDQGGVPLKPCRRQSKDRLVDCAEIFTSLGAFQIRSQFLSISEIDVFDVFGGQFGVDVQQDSQAAFLQRLT